MKRGGQVRPKIVGPICPSQTEIKKKMNINESCYLEFTSEELKAEYNKRFRSTEYTRKHYSPVEYLTETSIIEELIKSDIAMALIEEIITEELENEKSIDSG